MGSLNFEIILQNISCDLEKWTKDIDFWPMQAGSLGLLADQNSLRSEESTVTKPRCPPSPIRGTLCPSLDQIYPAVQEKYHFSSIVNDDDDGMNEWCFRPTFCNLSHFTSASTVNQNITKMTAPRLRYINLQPPPPSTTYYLKYQQALSRHI